jgi:hypothetical protein
LRPGLAGTETLSQKQKQNKRLGVWFKGRGLAQDPGLNPKKKKKSGE